MRQVFDVLRSRIARDAGVAENTGLPNYKIMKLGDVIVLADQDVPTSQLSAVFGVAESSFTQDKPVPLLILPWPAPRDCPTFRCTVMPRVATVRTRPEQMQASELRALVQQELSKDNGLLVLAMLRQKQSPTLGLLQEILQKSNAEAKQEESNNTTRNQLTVLVHAPDAPDEVHAALRVVQTSATCIVASNFSLAEHIGRLIPYGFVPEAIEEERKQLLAQMPSSTTNSLSLDELVEKFTQNFKAKDKCIQSMRTYQAECHDGIDLFFDLEDWVQLESFIIANLPHVPHYNECRKRFASLVSRIFDRNWTHAEKEIDVVARSLTRCALVNPAYSSGTNWPLLFAAAINVVLPALLNPKSYTELDCSDDFEPQRSKIAVLDKMAAMRKSHQKH